MRKEFFDLMYNKMADNKDIYMLFIGLGYPRVDEFLKAYPNRAINTEASEQTALDIAVGLTYSGKKVFTYTITPFYLRAWETVRTYINHEKLAVTLVGAGRDDQYGEDGISHWAWDIPKHFDLMENIKQYYPTEETLSPIVDKLCKTNEPAFLSLRR